MIRSLRTYSTAGAFRRALEERLKKTSQTDRIDINRLRRQLSFDRLLARLFRDDTEPWILKGGYALELRFGNARSTVDLDLTLRRLASSTSESVDVNTAVQRMLQRAVDAQLGDWFEYVIGPAVMDLTAAPYTVAPVTQSRLEWTRGSLPDFTSTQALATLSSSRMTRSSVGTGWVSRESRRPAFA